MKITKINISNFLKLRDVEINPTHTNVIVGKNGQGKTSILKAIRGALDGKVDDSFIHTGEDKAEILLELDDYIVKRTITSKGNYLDISNKEGMKMPSPQKYLDGLIGSFSFNPVAFFDLKAKERKTYLLNAIKMNITPEELKTYTGEELTGLDFTKHALEVLEDARKFYYDKRTIANAEMTKKEKTLAELSESIPQGFDPSKVNEEHIANLRAAITKDETEKIKADNHDKNLLALQARETKLKKELEEVQAEIAANVSVTFDVSDDVTIQTAKDTLTKLESQREHLFTHKRVEELRGEVGEAMTTAKSLDEVVKKLTKEAPQELIKKAQLPIEGMTVDGDEIHVNGVNIDNLSSSEQIKFGLDIVRALNSEFKVICIDGIEALDLENFNTLLANIETDSYQYFVTRVDGNSEHSIVIDGGEIKKA